MIISIITAAKNNKAGLLRAIESVRSQTYKNYEHIIIDGASTDGTAELIKNLEFRIKNDKNVQVSSRTNAGDLKDFSDASLIRNDQVKDDDSPKTNSYELRAISEKDSGIYDAINKGIKMAAGDIIGLLHSDDIYAGPEVLSSVAKVFDENSTDAVYGDLLYVRYKAGSDANESSVSYSVLRYWKTQKNNFTSIRQREKAIKFGWMPPHPALFIRKEIFEKYGYYRTDMKIAADYEMILRLLFRNRITAHYLPITTHLMSTGGASNKSLGNIFIKSREDLNAMKINKLPFPLLTLLCKNFRKLSQFVKKN